jgi:UPF0716 protein FxsA
MLIAAALIVMGILEIYVIVQVGQAIGALYTIALLIVMGILGVWLAKREGFAVFRRFRQTAADGRVPTTEVIDGFLIFTGAVLMIAPGFISDIIGILLLIPPTRAIPRNFIKRRFRITIIDQYGPQGRGPRPVPPDDVIDI